MKHNFLEYKIQNNGVNGKKEKKDQNNGFNECL